MNNRKAFLVTLVGSVVKRGALAGLAGLWLALAAPTAYAGKVEDLSKILSEDSSYKVRVQAALVLGKLGDRNAVAALAKALNDENNTVRAVAAQALGRIGAPEAGEHLKRALTREKDKFVRSQLERSLAGLGRESGDTSQKANLYLEFGPFSGGSKSATPAVLEVLRAALRQKLGGLKGVAFSLSPEEKASFVKSGRMGFLIDGNVTQLDESMVGGAVEVNCDVKVMVARWPSKSIIMWTSAGAAVQGGSRPQDKETARRDCLEASAGQLGDDLKRFFQSQGG